MSVIGRGTGADQVEAGHVRDDLGTRAEAVVAVPLARIDRCALRVPGHRRWRRGAPVGRSRSSASGTVKKSLGNGSRQAVGSIGSHGPRWVGSGSGARPHAAAAGAPRPATTRAIDSHAIHSDAPQPSPAAVPTSPHVPHPSDASRIDPAARHPHDVPRAWGGRSIVECAHDKPRGLSSLSGSFPAPFFSLLS